MIGEEFDIQPFVPVVEFTVFYGNLCQRIIMPWAAFHYSIKGSARISKELDSDPLCQLHGVG